MDVITIFQYSLIYNALSFTLAAMAATTLFLWISRSDVAPAYRVAVTISGVVTAIAAYHYWRIFNSWEAAFEVRNGVVSATGYAFNDAYRYVDWLLTVPLLLIELVLVMRLDPAQSSKMSLRLGFAAALMIVLGYPGEIASAIPARAFWGTLSAIPFVYIVWQLFSGLGASIERQPEAVKGLVKQARLLTFASWGFYPIVYMAPYVHLSGADALTTIQVGYTIADLVAKAVVGVLVFNIALSKSKIEAA